MNAGDRVGDYTIIEYIGGGANADVYLAMDHSRGGREVALKVIREDGSDWMEERGAQFLMQVDHPNIVNVHFVGKVGGRFVIDMEYVRGQNLRTILRENGPLPEKEALSTAFQICFALAYLHGMRIDGARGVAHLDLKPSNILVEAGGRVRLADFGTARLGDAAATTMSCGSPSYMAPEQFRGRPMLASDVWAVGVMLFEMLSGSSLFRGKTVEEIKAAVLDEAQCWRSRLNLVPAHLRPIVSRSLSFAPEMRYPTVEEQMEDVFVALQHSAGAEGPAGPRCPVCGEVFSGGGVCLECTRAPRPSTAPTGSLTPPDGPPLQGGGPAHAPPSHGRRDSSSATLTQPPPPSDREGKADWKTKTILLHPALPEPQPGTSPTRPMPRGAKGGNKDGRAGRVAASVVLLALVAGAAYSMWMLTKTGSGRSATTSGRPVEQRDPSAVDGVVKNKLDNADNQRAKASPAKAPGPHQKPSTRPPATLPEPSTPHASEQDRRATGESHDPNPTVSPGLPADPGRAQRSTAEAPGARAARCADLLNRFRALEKSPEGSYDDRISAIAAFVRECPNALERGEAEARLSVWTEEKDDFAEAEFAERDPGARICTAIEAWRRFLKSNSTDFRRPHAEMRMQYWAERLLNYEGWVNLRVASASPLPMTDLSIHGPAAPDPFYVLYVDGEPVYISRPVNKTVSPSWMEAVRFQVMPDSDIALEFWDMDFLLHDFLLRVHLDPLPEDGVHTFTSEGVSVKLEIRRDD